MKISSKRGNQWEVGTNPPNPGIEQHVYVHTSQEEGVIHDSFTPDNARILARELVRYADIADSEPEASMRKVREHLKAQAEQDRKTEAESGT